jgi:DNA-binding NtrC family response regulator
MRPHSDARSSVKAATRRPTDDQDSLEALVDALRAYSGNVARAAEAVGISRSRAYRLLDAQPDFDLAGFRSAPGTPSSVPPKRIS